MPETVEIDELAEAIRQIEAERGKCSRRIRAGNGRLTELAGEVAAFDASVAILRALMSKRAQGRLRDAA